MSEHSKKNKQAYDDLVSSPCYKFCKSVKERYFENRFLAYLFFVTIDFAGKELNEAVSKRKDKKLRKEYQRKLDEAVSTLKEDARKAISAHSYSLLLSDL